MKHRPDYRLLRKAEIDDAISDGNWSEKAISIASFPDVCPIGSLLRCIETIRKRPAKQSGFSAVRSGNSKLQRQISDGRTLLARLNRTDIINCLFDFDDSYTEATLSQCLTKDHEPERTVDALALMAFDHMYDSETFAQHCEYWNNE